MPPVHDPLAAAWHANIEARLAELSRLAAGRRWSSAHDAAGQLRDVLVRAEVDLVVPHAAQVQRAAAIAARAAWEEARAAARVQALEAAFLAWLDLAPELRLQEVLAVDPQPPPGWPGLAGRWAHALGDWSGRWRGQGQARSRLQREALRLDLGAEGLRALAAQSDELDVWLAWIEALDAEGRTPDALKAASEGARLLYFPRHRMELRLVEGTLAARLGRAEQSHRAFREVWRQRQCTAGLCMVWQAAHDRAAPFVAEELELAYTGERPLPADLQVRMELLLGDAELPLARLQAASTAGWWLDKEHPATQVLPFLIRLGSHQAHLDEGLLLARIWRATDDDQRWRPRPPDPVPTGWSKLVDEVIRTHPTWLTDAAAWRITAANALVELAGAVLDAKARGAFLKIAALLVALVEAGTVAQDPEAEAPLQAIRRRFPRNKALLQTIEETRAFSPVLRTVGQPGPR